MEVVACITEKAAEADRVAADSSRGGSKEQQRQRIAEAAAGRLEAADSRSGSRGFRRGSG